MKLTDKKLQKFKKEKTQRRVSEELLKELSTKKVLKQDDLKHLLNKIDKDFKLRALCKNTSLIKELLVRSLFDKRTVERFNKILENHKDPWYTNRNIFTVFDLIQFHTTYYFDQNTLKFVLKEEKDRCEDVLKLNELSRLLYVFEFSREQKQELIEILSRSESAINNLKQIIDNNLEATYNFSQLKDLITKDDKKKRIKLNF